MIRCSRKKPPGFETFLFLPLALLFLSACSGPRTPQLITVQPREKQNVVILLFDALRASNLGCYGASPSPSPTMDSLAEDGIVFEHCYSQATWTTPSVATIFTGYLPGVHECGLSETKGSVEIRPLRPSFVTVAEQFQSSGYKTGAFIGNSLCERGFDQGFDGFKVVNQWPAEEHAKEVCDWLDACSKEATGRPVFLWVHFWLPHYYRPDHDKPYVAPDQFYQALYKDTGPPLTDNDKRIVAQLANVLRARLKNEGYDGLYMKDLSPAGKEAVRRAYNSNVLYADQACLKPLVEKLRELQMMDNTLLAIVADHGEELFDHGEFGHHLGRLYDEAMRVPLILYSPGMTPARIQNWSSLADIGPTVLTLSKIRPIESQARSIFSADGILLPVNRFVFTECYNSVDDDSLTVQYKGEKLIFHVQGNLWESFDLTEDPMETNGAAPLQSLSMMQSRLLEKLAEDKELRQRFGPVSSEKIDADMQEQLRSLGYLH